MVLTAPVDRLIHLPSVRGPQTSGGDRSVGIRSSDRGLFGDRDDAGVVEGDTLHSSRDLLNICVKIQEGGGGS